MIEDIEYGDYQHGNQVSFDNDMIKKWVNTIPIDISNDSITPTFALIETLLFEGEYMPFIRRNANQKLVDSKFIQTSSWLSGKFDGYMEYKHESLNIKGEKNKIYLNNKDVTEKLRVRYNKFLNLCKELQNKNELGAIWYYWKGEKL